MSKEIPDEWWTNEYAVNVFLSHVDVSENARTAVTNVGRAFAQTRSLLFGQTFAKCIRRLTDLYGAYLYRVVQNKSKVGKTSSLCWIVHEILLVMLYLIYTFISPRHLHKHLQVAVTMPMNSFHMHTESFWFAKIFARLFTRVRKIAWRASATNDEESDEACHGVNM